MVNYSFAKFHHIINSAPEIKNTLKHFESRHSLNASIILLILWHIKNQLGRLTRTQLTTLMELVTPWHERIIKPLARLQSLMLNRKANELIDETNHLLEFSLVYEINLLETHLPNFKHNSRTSKTLISDSCQNILVYCKLTDCQLNDKDIAALYTLLSCVYDGYDANDIKAACNKHINAYNLKQPLSYEQMLLEEL